jgi:para-nitrobenzyl esterase
LCSPHSGQAEFMPAFLTRIATASFVVLAALSISASTSSYGDARTQDLAIPRATIETGILEGTRLLRGVNEIAFLGIPYAAPPVAELRWKPPKLPVKWQGARAAEQFAPSCIQFPSSWWPEMAGRNQLETSEDCLYLNVWTASLSPPLAAPVIVWIHGGGNVEGSSQIPPLASALVSKGVVFVSIEYRLGVFGFFAHPALTAESDNHSSGNYGLLDQIAALDWVRHNIQAFGGDPARVTILGQSSGAENVCHLLASPLAAGLFHRAILESGVCLDSLYSALSAPQGYFGNHGPGEAQGLRLATALGIPGGSEVLEKLRGVSAERLLEVSRGLDAADFGVIVDGWVVPSQPVTTFAKRQQTRIPVLVGSTANETTVFGKSSPLAAEDSRPKTVDHYRRWLRSEFGEFAEDVWKVYPADSDRDVPAVFVRMQTDYAFGFGAHRLAQAMTETGQQVYLYYFTYTGRGPFKALGAFHSEELMFVGDSYWTSWIVNDGDRKLADLMGDYWTQFAKNGDPNRTGLPHWEPYDPKSEQCLEIGATVKSRPTPHRDGYAVFDRILMARLRETASRSEMSHN